MWLIAVSCKKNEKPDVYIDQSAMKDTTQTVAGNSGRVTQNAQTVPTTPGANGVVSQVKSPATATAPGMNPPHGQPGHRCDISVGAPLSSPPSNPAQQQVTQVTPVQNSTPVKTAPGMNPPHGEPGHRCDITVGAPLNSTPAKTSTTSAPAQTQTQTLPATVAAPQNSESQALASGAKPATNPEHGQPFHRCDLAVGAALP